MQWQSSQAYPKVISKKLDLEQEALKIILMAEDMGLQLKRPKEEAVMEIKEQLEGAII